MMHRLKLATALSLVPALASADSQLDRMEGLAEGMNNVMVEMMALGVEAEGGDATVIRDLKVAMPEWDDAMRDAASCVLDRYNAAAGRDEVDAMLDRTAELIASMEGTNPEEFDALLTEEAMDGMLPSGMTTNDAGQISQECGMMELQMRDMQETGLFEAMMQAGSTIPDS